MAIDLSRTFPANGPDVSFAAACVTAGQADFRLAVIMI
jgi:hypothetical protein